MAFPLILAAAGAALSIYGQIKGAEADAEAARREAASRELEADEILKRVQVNQAIVQEEGDILMGQQTTFFAGSGVQMGRSPLAVLERTAHGIAREKKNMDIEAQFRAAQLRSGAVLSRDLAGQRMQAGYISAAGTLLTRGYDIYSSTNRKSSTDTPKDKPSVFGAGPMRAAGT